MLVRPFALVAAAMILICPSAGSAQSRDRTTAEALFQAGRDAAKNGDFATACQRFEESNRLDPAPGTVFNMAHCAEQLGLVASAWQRYREVVDRLPASDSRVALAQRRAKELEPRLPYLTLKLASDAPPEATVERDGVELGAASLDLELPIDPGKHRVIVSAPGHEPRIYDLELAEAEHRTLEVEVGEAALPTSAKGPKVGSGASVEQDGNAPAVSRRSTWGYVLGGVGLGGIAVSLGAGALALSHSATVDDQCDATRRCSPEGLDAADSGRTMTTVANVAFAVGVLGVGLGAYLILSHDDDPVVTTVEARATAEGGVLTLQGRFW